MQCHLFQDGVGTAPLADAHEEEDNVVSAYGNEPQAMGGTVVQPLINLVPLLGRDATRPHAARLRDHGYNQPQVPRPAPPADPNVWMGGVSDFYPDGH